MTSRKETIVAQSTRWKPGLWILAALAIPAFGMVAAFGTVDETPAPVATRSVVEVLALPSFGSSAETAASTYFHEERFDRGDTIADLLERFGVDDEDVRLLLKSAQAKAIRLLRPGTTVQAVTDGGKLQSLWFIHGSDSLVRVERAPDGFTASQEKVALERRVELKSAAIESSLFAATDDARIPDNVASQIADIFGGDIDFNRDLRRGDRFTVVFEMFFHNGRAIKSGRVLAAEFVNQKRDYRAVWYEPEGGHGGYYAPDGKSLRKAFLRSPLEFSRITSGFGRRMHPILHKWRNHKGIDYGAPSGTKVRATGDGVVEFAGQQRGYGNVIILKHHGGFETFYAHLRGFARGLHRGTRVDQGDIIGYVGQTGWATGPHLHYEFHVNGQYRNPLAVVLPAAHPIAREQLPTFLKATHSLAAQLDLFKNSNFALLE